MAARPLLLTICDADAKSNIYYQDVELFGSQYVVDQLVDDLAYTLGFGRSDLNVVWCLKICKATLWY